MQAPSLTLGVEEEYQIIDPKTRELTSYITQILEDPHYIDREVIADYPDADMEAFPMHHVVPRLDRTPGSIRTPSPKLGQHNRELLALVGVNDDAYAQLLEGGFVYEEGR